MQNIYGVLMQPHGQQAHPLQQANPVVSTGSMAPPPDGTFATRDELLNYLKSWAASQGYAVVIGRSRVNRLWIRCDRGGEYRDKHANDPAARQRKRKESRLTGCEFSIKASMRTKDGLWRSRCECGQHNHGPSEDLREHPSLRRMTDEQLTKVHELTDLGKSPAEIMEALHAIWPDIKIIRRDIYNARKNFRLAKDGVSVTSSAPPSAPSSVPASATTSFNASFDDSSRMPAPSDSGRWAWMEDDRVVTKKRKLTGSPSKGSESEATQSFNSTTSDGPSAQLAMESFSSMPTATASPLQEHQQQSSSWSRRAMAASARPPNIMSPDGSRFLNRAADAISQQLGHLHSSSNDFAAPGMGPSMMRPRGGEFTGTATSHLTEATAGMHANAAIYARMNAGQNMNFNLSNHNINSLQTHPERRQSSQTGLIPNLRNPPAGSPRTSPVTSRRPSYSLASAAQPTAVSQAQSAAAPVASTSRPGSSALQQQSGEPTSTTSVASSTMPAPSHIPQQSSQQPSSQPPPPQQQQQAQTQTPTPAQQQQQKMQSGAVIMQRMQRFEDELREQKSVLNEILSVVQNLQTGGNKPPQG